VPKIRNCLSCSHLIDWQHCNHMEIYQRRSAAPLAAVAAGTSVGALAWHSMVSGSMVHSETFLAMPPIARLAPPSGATGTKALEVDRHTQVPLSSLDCKLSAASAVLGAAVAAKAAHRFMGRYQRRRTVRVQCLAEGESSSQDSGPELKSDLGIDYSKLDGLLKDGDFKAADAESRRLLIEMAGTEAVKRGWVYFAEVRRIPETDMLTLNDLWGHYSKGKFGFVPQRKIWRRVREQFDKFAEEVSWFTDKWKNRNWPDEFVYSLDAPVGHLPLTNCIRGAQVLAELLNHPAFEKKRPASSSSSVSSGGDKPKRSALSMLAEGGIRTRLGQASPLGVAAFAGSSTNRLGACAVRNSMSSMAVATAEVEVAAPPAKLEELEEHKVINDHGLILPHVPESAQASAFLIYDMQHKPQYLGFSKDLRNTLRTLLCRRPEMCYFYKCVHFEQADNAALLQARTSWINELGSTPPGNKEPRQKGLWETPVDGGAMNERAWKTVAEQKAKQVLRQLKDRGLKEHIEFKGDLIEQGKVDALPSTLNAEDLMAQQSAVSDRTSSVEKDVGSKRVAFEIFFMSEFATKGGWWLDVEVTYQKQKTTHRVIVGKDFAEAVGKENPRDIVENAFAVLLARRVPMHTEGMITSEVFPVNYFTATNVATQFPEFLELFGSNSEKFDWDRAQWNFKQVHDYSQDDKRTMPSPLGGVFDPLALQ